MKGSEPSCCAISVLSGGLLCIVGKSRNQADLAELLQCKLSLAQLAISEMPKEIPRV